MNYSKIALLFCFVVTCGVASAQKFSLGVKAGVLGVYTNFGDQKDTLKSGVKFGYSLAGMITFPLKHNFSFTAEAGFSQQGRKWKNEPNQNTWTSTYYFYDMSMALRKTFKLKIAEHISSTWFFNFGPNINYWIGGNGRMDPYKDPLQTVVLTQYYSLVFDQPPNNSYTQIHINNANRWLFGLNLGIGTTFTTLKNQKIIAELRLTWGQTYLGQRHSESLGGTPKINEEMSLKCNLKVLNFSVGYVFDRDLRLGKMGKSTKKLK